LSSELTPPPSKSKTALVARASFSTTNTTSLDTRKLHASYLPTVSNTHPPPPGGDGNGDDSASGNGNGGGRISGEKHREGKQRKKKDVVGGVSISIEVDEQVEDSSGEERGIEMGERESRREGRLGEP
jgi:hypothetical protein